MTPTTLKLADDRGRSALASTVSLKSVENLHQRCVLHGAGTLSVHECLALLLRRSSGAKGGRLASDLMKKLASGMDEETQARALFSTLETACSSPSPDLGLLNPMDEARILAAFELARRYHFYREGSKSTSRLRLGESELEGEALSKIGPEWRGLSVEWLGFVPVYKHSRVGNLCVVERGARTHVNVDPAELFARILVLRPRMIFLFHNHPSGDLTASREDKHLTRHVDDLCKKLGIQLASHWIVSGPNQAEVPIDGSY